MGSFAPYNFTIPDQSPTFHYTPYADGDRTGGWNVSYTGSDDASFINNAPQSVPLGTSFHRTSFRGASANISWIGTACYLYGDAQAGSYTTTIDSGTAVNGAPISDQHLLVVYSGLKYGEHTLRLDVVQSQEVIIQAAVLTVGIGDRHAIQNTTVRATDDAQNINPDLQLTGRWNILTQDKSNLVRPPFPIIVSTGVGQSIAYTFRNTSAFLMYSDCYWDHSIYTISVQNAEDPAAPTVVMQGNGSSRWLSDPCLMYFQTGMDRDMAYQLTFQNTGHIQSFHYFMILDAPPSESTSDASSLHEPRSLSGGVITAIVVAAVVAVLCSSIGAFMLRRYRRRKARSDETFGGDVVEWQPTLQPSAPAVVVRKPPIFEPARRANTAAAPATHLGSSTAFISLSTPFESISRDFSSFESRAVRSDGSVPATAISSMSLPPQYDPSWRHVA